MPHDRIEALLRAEIAALETAGRLKGRETVVAGIVPAADGKGPRYLIEGECDRPFIRMNSNGYLGLSTIKAVREVEESAVDRFGTGPGAVRFIGGTWSPHVALERRLAAFHGREAAMAYSSAYAAVMGVLLPLIGPETAVISDALNHNSIINAVRLAQPGEKRVYRHLDSNHLEQELKAAARHCRRAIVVTDGVFSMRGDHAPPSAISLASPRPTIPHSPKTFLSSSTTPTASALSGRPAGAPRNSPLRARSTSSSGRSARLSGSTADTSRRRRRSSITCARRRLSTSIRTRSRREKRPPQAGPSTSSTARKEKNFSAISTP